MAERLVTDETFFAYVDTSGSQAKGATDIMVTACVVMRKRKAENLDREWLAVFAEHEVTTLHMEEFAPGRGEYASWKEDRARRDAFLIALAKSAKRNVNKIFVTVLEKSAFQQVNTTFRLAERFQGPYAAALIFTLGKAVDWAVHRPPDSGMAILVEDGDVGQAAFLNDAERLLGFRPHVIGKRDPDTGQAVTPVALADFIAYEFRKAYERHVKGNDPRPSRIGMEHLDQLPRETFILDAATFLKFCELMKLAKR